MIAFADHSYCTTHPTNPSAHPINEPIRTLYSPMNALYEYTLFMLAGSGIRPLTLDEYPPGLTPSDLTAWAHQGLSPLYLTDPTDF